MTGPPPAEPPWPAGSGTGVGSLPGRELADAVAMVLDLVPELPYLPELPDRGPGADLVGRGAAHLTDLHVDLQPAGWRLVPRAGVDERRARDLLARDVDTFTDRLAGFAGAVKLQVAGPWTLAAALELARGGRALADPGAVRDLSTSLAEGTVAVLAEVAHRLPTARLLLQVDEPGLAAVHAGAVPTPSGFGRIPAVDGPVLRETLRDLLTAVRPHSAGAVLHCCADDPPLDVLTDVGAHALSLDLTRLPPAAADRLGPAVETGLGLFAGVVPTVPPAGSVRPGDLAGQVRRWWQRVDGPVDRLPAAVVVTPACGLVAAPAEWARTAMRLCAQTARRLAEAPDEMSTR